MSRLRDGKDFDARRRQLISVAADVFYRKGFARGTLTEITRRVGITQPAIYHYVSSKEDLLLEIMQQVGHDISQALATAMAASDDPRQQLLDLVTNLTDAIIVNQRTFAVYWTEMYTIPEAERTRIRRDERTFVDGVEALVISAQQRGDLPASRPSRVITEALLGMVTWTYQWYRPDGPLDSAGIADVFLDVLGLQPDVD